MLPGIDVNLGLCLGATCVRMFGERGDGEIDATRSTDDAGGVRGQAQLGNRQETDLLRMDWLRTVMTNLAEEEEVEDEKKRRRKRRRRRRKRRRSDEICHLLGKLVNKILNL